MDFWDGKMPCWEIKKCKGQPGKGEDCVAYKYTKYPCWNAANTLCKGKSGKDVIQCKSCEVYLNYGEGKPILCFDVTKMK